jgi:hypothetical protein
MPGGTPTYVTYELCYYLAFEVGMGLYPPEYFVTYFTVSWPTPHDVFPEGFKNSFNKNKKVSWVELGPTLVYLSKAMRFGTYSSSEALGTSTKYCSTVVVSRICLVQVFAGKESGLIDY